MYRAQVYYQLGALWQEIANSIHHRVDSDGPNDWNSLRSYYDATGEVYVSDLNCESSIYGIEGNLSFRVVHDWIHLTWGIDFTDEGERHVARIQSSMAESRLGADARNVTWFDTYGQVLFRQIHGDFPKDQSFFVDRCILHLENGTRRDDAILSAINDHLF